MKMYKRLWRPLAIVLHVAACGSSDAPVDAPSLTGTPDATLTGHPACSTFTACGGDPVGTWAGLAACVPELPDCPGATVDTSGLQLSGGFTFDADLGYSTDLAFSGTIALLRPLSCLRSGTSCAELGDDRVTCAVVGDACRCELPAPRTQAERGTWSAAATSLTTTPIQSSQIALTAEYCVGNDVLVMITNRAERSLVLTRVGSP